MDKEETTKEFKKILRDEWKQNRKIPKHMRHSESSAKEKKTIIAINAYIKKKKDLTSKI